MLKGFLHHIIDEYDRNSRKTGSGGLKDKDILHDIVNGKRDAYGNRKKDMEDDDDNDN